MNEPWDTEEVRRAAWHAWLNNDDTDAVVDAIGPIITRNARVKPLPDDPDAFTGMSQRCGDSFFLLLRDSPDADRWQSEAEDFATRPGLISWCDTVGRWWELPNHWYTPNGPNWWETPGCRVCGKHPAIAGECSACAANINADEEDGK